MWEKHRGISHQKIEEEELILVARKGYLPEDALTRRRIGFYERHGLVFNSYPYLQPPMRKGQGVLPLRLMTKPAAIDAKTYQRYKKRIHSIVYKYEGDL